MRMGERETFGHDHGHHGMTKPVLLTKSLQIDYTFPCAPLSPENQAVVFDGKKWVMR